MNNHSHELWLLTILSSIVGLFVARDCVERTPPVNLFPQVVHCQTCPCPATDAGQKPEVVPDSDRDRKAGKRRPKGAK